MAAGAARGTALAEWYSHAVDNEAAGSTDTSKLQLLRKAMDTLNLLAVEGEMTRAEIAERLSEPRSSVYRLVGVMEELELVEPGRRQGAYRLGMALLRLGSIVTRAFDVRTFALPAMEGLHDATGETVFLCLRRGREAVCVERLAGRRVQSLALTLGGSLPLHLGAAPSVLLAYQEREYWEQYAVGQMEPTALGETAAPKDLFARLEQIRETGYALSDGDVTDGIAAVGAPIFDHQGNVVASLSVSGIRQAIIEDGSGRVADLTVKAASAVSAALGYQRAELARAGAA